MKISSREVLPPVRRISIRVQAYFVPPLIYCIVRGGIFIDKKEGLIRIFSKDIRNILRQVSVDFEQVQELRMRVQAPLLMIHNNREFYVTSDGKLSKVAEEAFRVGRKDLKETLEYMSDYSLYAFEEEVRQGFITIQGGHRIGIAGKTVTDANGIRSMKFISFIKIGRAHV